MKDWLQLYPDSLFATRNDPLDPRLGELVTLDAPEGDFIFWGYPDDDGIRLSGGRPGASQAPLSVREILYKMTPPLENEALWKIFDAGFLQTEATLEARHHRGRKIAAAWTRLAKNWMTLGGGHDYGYSDVSGFIEAQIEKEQRPFVINFDAHLDVRPLDRGLTSGTPFYRVIEEFKGQFDFLEVGIQEHCNSQAHAEYVLEHGGNIVTLNEIREHGGLGSCLKPYLKKMKDTPTFLSMDIDVFSSTEAPGCSQSWPVGLSSQEFFSTFPEMIKKLNIQALGIYEVSPLLDASLQTQRLAALILYQFMMQTTLKKEQS